MAKKNTKSNLPKYNKRLPKYTYGSYLNRPNYAPQYNTGTDPSGTQAGIGAVSAVNPIIGGIAGMGEAMVSPLEQNFKSVNQGSGKFDNRNQAVGADVVRSIFDPATTMSRTFQDPGASAFEKIATGLGAGALFAGKRADRLEEGNMREAQSVKNQERNRVQAGEYYQNQQIQGQNQQGTQRFQNGGDLPDMPNIPSNKTKSRDFSMPYATDTGKQFWPMKPTSAIIRDTANYFQMGVGDNQEPIFGTFNEELAPDSGRYKSSMDESNHVYHPSSLLRKLASTPPTEQFLKSQPRSNFPGFENGGQLGQQKGSGNFTTYEGQGHEGPDGGIPVDQMGNPAIVSGEEPVGLTENKESTFDGYVFSEELKPDNKRSFSDLAKALNKKYYG